MKLLRRTWLVELSALALTAVTALAGTPKTVDFYNGDAVQAATGDTEQPSKLTGAEKKSPAEVSDAGKKSAKRTRLQDLHDIQQLRKAFNAASGRPRLILLLSPT